MKAIELFCKIDEIQRKHKMLKSEQEKNIIELISQFKKEVCEKQRYICQIEMDKDSVEDENGKWYVSCEDVLNAQEPD